VYSGLRGLETAFWVYCHALDDKAAAVVAGASRLQSLYGKWDVVDDVIKEVGPVREDMVLSNHAEQQHTESPHVDGESIGEGIGS